MAQHLIQIPINKMTYIDYNNPVTSYLGQATAKLGGQNVYVPSVYDATKHLLFEYELSVPTAKKYISHKMCLYSVGAAAPGASIIYEINSYAVWNNPTWDNSGRGFYGGAMINVNIVTNGWLSIPVKSGSLGTRTFRMYEYRQEPTSPNFEFNTNIAASNKPYIELTYEDVPPDAPSPIDPIGVFKDNQSVVKFEWKYNSSVGGVQKAFDLQWSQDGVTWNNVSQTTSNNYYDMPANTLPSGNIYWRVRCYNEYDEVSEYSNISAFYSIGAPVVPVIDTIPTDTARPTISWASSQQQVYQMQILQGENVVYDSGNIPGILEKVHKVKTFLWDGIYTAKVRVKNEYDIWSEWGERTFTVSTVKPNKPSLTLYNTRCGLQIHITPVDGAAYYLVYRSEYHKDDYTCIGKTDTVKFDDNTEVNNKDYKYFVRAVTADEAYMDSDIKVGCAVFKHTLIAPVSDLNNVLMLKYGLNKKPTKNSQSNLRGDTTYYSGREYAVTEFSENVESQLSLAFAFKTYAEVEQFMGLYGLRETILYRDSKGRKLYGTLNNLSVQEDISAYVISFTITQTDYTEGVEV